jgi:peptidoglycan/xylan/chitin deacetylase (PgdA/CDA1 family)
VYTTRRRKLARFAAAGLALTGAGAMLRARRRQAGDYRLHVLAYHEVSDGPEREGTVSQDRFRRHVRLLKDLSRIVPIDEACDMLREGARLTEDGVVITFDDGYLGNYCHALQVLKAERVSATVFVTTGFIDGAELWFERARQLLRNVDVDAAKNTPSATNALKEAFGSWPLPAGDIDSLAILKRLPPTERNRLLDAAAQIATVSPSEVRPMTWEQIGEMSSSGVEIGCHTVTHPILSTLDADAQREEIGSAARRIEAVIGRRPRFFAYPNGGTGDFSEVTVQALKDNGFSAACTMVRGYNRAGCDPFRLKRIGVGADPGYVLRARLSGIFERVRETA